MCISRTADAFIFNMNLAFRLANVNVIASDLGS